LFSGWQEPQQVIPDIIAGVEGFVAYSTNDVRRFGQLNPQSLPLTWE